MHASVTLQSSWLLVLRSAHHQLLTRWCVRCQLPRRFSLVKGDYCAHSHSHHRDKHEEAAYKWCMHQRRTISFQNATLWKWWTPKVVVMFKNHNSVWSCSGQPPHTVKGQEKKKGASGEESVLKGESLQQCQTRHRLLRARLESRLESRTSSVVFVFLQDVSIFPLDVVDLCRRGAKRPHWQSRSVNAARLRLTFCHMTPIIRLHSSDRCHAVWSNTPTLRVALATSEPRSLHTLMSERCSGVEGLFFW